MNDNLIECGEEKDFYRDRHGNMLYSVDMYHIGLDERKTVTGYKSASKDGCGIKDAMTLQAEEWSKEWLIVSTAGIGSEINDDLILCGKVRDVSSGYGDSRYTVGMRHTGLKEYKSISAREEFILKEKVILQAQKWSEKWLRISSTEAGIQEAIDKTEEAKATFNQIDNLLLNTLAIDNKIDWESLKKNELFNEVKPFFTSKVFEWDKRKKNFIQAQNEYNATIDKFKNAYLIGEDGTLEKYCELVLSNSQYPYFFPKKFELEYNAQTKTLIIEYKFPDLSKFPRIKEVRFISSKNELKPVLISESQINKIFDDALYKITLRTLYELFSTDAANGIDLISFNGWVTTTNKATGKEEDNCILSIQVSKIEFNNIILSKVDPKACFKKLKGVSSSRLSSLIPIQPLLRISKTDKRFIDGYDVVDTLNDTTNLAAMDWEDFEHLIRELFEKEFQSNGGEVKVTQASRDGGVDAIAFDPDPIRGGKIVIQAKRYTNTVSVSAVRDLYGTVLNEGATKGLLVSTADYGTDAYEFAKGKPLTLLNGSNLLHLLQKHGHHARIDLKDAKRIFAENSKS